MLAISEQSAGAPKAFVQDACLIAFSHDISHRLNVTVEETIERAQRHVFEMQSCCV